MTDMGESLYTQAELDQVREVLNTDLKIAQERVLTLELENRRLKAALKQVSDELKALSVQAANVAISPEDLQRMLRS